MQRKYRTVELKDPALFAAYGAVHLLYASNSDGGARVLEYQRPFYSVRTPWATEIDARDFRQVDRIYAGGQAVAAYAHDWTQFVGRYAVAVSSDARNAFRVGVGLDWRDDRFHPLADHPDDSRPDDRHFHYLSSMPRSFTTTT